MNEVPYIRLSEKHEQRQAARLAAKLDIPSHGQRNHPTSQDALAKKQKEFWDYEKLIVPWLAISKATVVVCHSFVFGR